MILTRSGLCLGLYGSGKTSWSVQEFKNMELKPKTRGQRVLFVRFCGHLFLKFDAGTVSKLIELGPAGIMIRLSLNLF